MIRIRPKTGVLAGGVGLERLLAALLQYGTWVGSFVMATGIVLRASGFESAMRAGSVAMTAGVCIVIVLPVARLVLMLAVYLAGREYRFAWIAAFVLLIVAAGCVAGVRLGPLAG
ncbi:hypothetical protein [Paraburkholderia acidipaludis]|uniref:hypothetical protein n=1 Tax=Paraburkholderia acidipaludis TaxID=660537 RepID=UPI0005BB4304|nr:hypothetical protein [Paraburkholderia acidipaludis]